MSSEVKVTKLPDCDFCKDGTKAEYDFITRMGPWANGCESHWIRYRTSPNLGTGICQKLSLKDGSK